jgi:hypothetical protein
MSPSTRGRRGDGHTGNTVDAAVDAHGDGPPPSDAEVRGAFDVMRDARARVPTARVGALVRALGARVEAGERDMLRKCEEVVDKNSLGWFELEKVRRRRRNGGREAATRCATRETRHETSAFSRERRRPQTHAGFLVCTNLTVHDSSII